jgi:acyl dehydratase
MAKLIVKSYDEFASYLGKELGKSEWLVIDQERINLFADATIDHQWIHVDTERAAMESPYKTTIAHGYLTLSLLPHLWEEVIEAQNIKLLVNYGMDKMRFGLPVKSGSRVRLNASLHNITNLRGVCKAEVAFKLEIENERKPAIEGIATFLYYFNN